MFGYRRYGSLDFLREATIPKKVWLDAETRVAIIRQGLDITGSINQLGRSLGYRSRTHPGWGIRQILLGRQAFPLERLEALLVMIDGDLDEVLTHQIKKDLINPENTQRELMKAQLWWTDSNR